MTAEEMLAEVSRLESAAAEAIVQASAASHAAGTLDVRDQHSTCPESRALLGQAHALRYRAEELSAEAEFSGEVPPAPPAAFTPIAPAAPSLPPRLEAIVARALATAAVAAPTHTPAAVAATKVPRMTQEQIDDAASDKLVASICGISVAELPTSAADWRRAAAEAAGDIPDAASEAELDALVARIVAA